MSQLLTLSPFARALFLYLFGHHEEGRVRNNRKGRHLRTKVREIAEIYTQEELMEAIRENRRSVPWLITLKELTAKIRAGMPPSEMTLLSLPSKGGDPYTYGLVGFVPRGDRVDDSRMCLYADPRNGLHIDIYDSVEHVKLVWANGHPTILVIGRRENERGLFASGVFVKKINEDKSVVDVEMRSENDEGVVRLLPRDWVATTHHSPPYETLSFRIPHISL